MGRPLADSIEAVSHSMPAGMAELFSVAASSEGMSGMVGAFLAQRCEVDELKRRFWHATLYPMTVSAIFIGWLLFVSLWLIPQVDLSDLFDGFGSPRRTEILTTLLKMTRGFPIVLLAALAVGVVVVGLAWLIGGAALVSRLAWQVPLFGKAWRERSLVEFSGLMALLLERGLRLHEALGLAARSASDPAIRAACRGMASDIERGCDLTQALAARSQFPRTLVYLVDWGTLNAALADAFASARQMYLDQFDEQLRFARLVFPPLMFVLVFGGAWFIVVAVTTPLIRLITDLS